MEIHFFLLKDETHCVCNQHCAVSALAKPPIRHLQTFYLLKRYKESALKSFQHCKNSLNHINTHIYIHREEVMHLVNDYLHFE